MKKLTRRDFMKISAAGASFLALSGYMGPLVSAMEMVLGGKEVSRTTGKFRKAVASTCLNCYARCGIFGYVDQNRVVKIGGNPLHPNNRGRICAKGQAGLNILYDPERLQYPIKRAGARGGGKWQRISWEEAYNELSGKLKELLQKGRPQELVIQSDRDITTQDFVRRFMNAFGSPNALNHTALGGSNKRMAHRITWGVDIDINDVAYTMYILNFGSNPYEAHILRTSFAQRIAEGRTIRMFDHRVYDRAKMVTFDVRCSQTAGRSDEWHSIKPGTDAIVALAMANVIMQENLHDAKFFPHGPIIRQELLQTI